MGGAARQGRGAAAPGWGDALRAGIDGIWALLMPFGIVGVLKFGIFTPTEAGVAACVYAFVVGVLVYRELPLRELYACSSRRPRAPRSSSS
jgi:TRAP-type C4-dicarboxylate transport system permease large subunit